MDPERQLFDRWLQGRSLIWERRGLDPLAAICKALEDWDEQKRLEAEYNAERNG